MKFTYYGHSCFSVEIGGKHLLFDPYISPNPLAAHVKVDEIPADYIFLSHGHDDHIADAVSIAKRTGAKVVTNYEIYVWMTNQGITNGHPMNTGGKWKFDFGTVLCTNAVHSSSFGDGSYAGNPMGFHIKTEEGSFYYSGDTALSMDMKLIGELLTTDVALLPIGDNFTMGPDEALLAAEYVNCKNIIALHYDTFGFIVIDKEKAVEKFADHGRKLHMVEIGESIDV